MQCEILTSLISFAVFIYSLSLFPFMENIFFCIFYYYGPQDIVLESSNVATTFKVVPIYKFHLTQCLETTGIIYNIDYIRICC